MLVELIYLKLSCFVIQLKVIKHKTEQVEESFLSKFNRKFTSKSMKVNVKKKLI